MVTAKEYFDMGMERHKTFNVNELMPALRFANSGAIEDVLNTNGCMNYQWGSSLVDVMKPKQIVELGGAMGVWDICILHTLPVESMLHSITLPEGGLEFSYVKDKYKNFHPIVGDDLDMNNWKGVDLSKTDLWYIDSLHEDYHIHKEMELYSPFMKKGDVVIFDDIYQTPKFEKACQEIKDGKYLKLDWYDATNPLHYTGYAVTVVL